MLFTLQPSGSDVDTEILATAASGATVTVNFSCTTGIAVNLPHEKSNIPLIYRILASVNPIASKSVVFDSEEKIAITADYAGGVQKLSKYFLRLPEKYRNKADKVLSFLRDEKNAQKYIQLECTEIFWIEDAPVQNQNIALVEELLGIDSVIEKSLEQIKNGDEFALRELDEEYWTNILFYTQSTSDEDEIQ